MESNDNQKRKMERFPLRLPVNIAVAGAEEEEALTCLTNDACAGGVFIETDKPLPISTEVKLDLVLPYVELKNFEGKGVIVKVSGEVIRIGETGMAIRFHEDYQIWPLAH